MSKSTDDPKPKLPTRLISRKSRVELPNFGFAGREHIAVQVFGPKQLDRTNPFVLLTDNELGFEPGAPMGAAQPHAGMETASLILEGALQGPQGELIEGDVSWISAGSGVIHDAYVSAAGRARVLQIWLALPEAARSAPPAVQVTPKAEIPVRREGGAEIRVYGDGALATSTMHSPVIICDIKLGNGAIANQQIPGDYRAFLYVVAGALRVGGTQLFLGDVGWMDPVNHPLTDLKVTAWAHGARVILFASAPTSETLVSRGLFVAGSKTELADKERAYDEGKFPRVSHVPRTLPNARGRSD